MPKHFRRGGEEGPKNWSRLSQQNSKGGEMCFILELMTSKLLFILYGQAIHLKVAATNLIISHRIFIHVVCFSDEPHHLSPDIYTCSMFLCSVLLLYCRPLLLDNVLLLLVVSKTSQNLISFLVCFTHYGRDNLTVCFPIFHYIQYILINLPTPVDEIKEYIHHIKLKTNWSTRSSFKR